MTKSILRIIFALLITLTMYVIVRLHDCNTFEQNVKATIAQYVGKEIFLPDTFEVIVDDSKLTIASPISMYKLLTIMDSEGCIACKLQLREWSELISQLQTGMKSADDIDLIYVIEGDVTKEILDVIRDHNFHRPIVIDRNMSIAKMNHLPREVEFRTFLLDNNNRILAVGNPIMFKDIKALYASIIKSDFNSTTQAIPVVPSQSRVPLGVIKDMNELTTTITLKNVSDSLLKIEGIKSSCHCISAIAKYQAIRPKGEVDIILKFRPEEAVLYEGKLIYRTVYVQFENIENSLEIELYAYNELFNADEIYERKCSLYTNID